MSFGLVSMLLVSFVKVNAPLKGSIVELPGKKVPANVTPEATV